MVAFNETDVTDPEAHALITEYFEDRARTFPGPNAYRPTYPTSAQFTPPAGVFLVIEDDGEPVGCGGIRWIEPGASGERYEIKHVYVRPATRGRGLGRAILSELERRALELGAAEVVLDTNASLEAAGHLYRAQGYRDIAAYNENPNATNWYAKSLR